ATYTDGMNVLEAGFVYSLFNGDLNLENANRVVYSNTLTDNDSYSILISDLSLGGIYYYRPYVIDDGGISYGTIQSFQLSAYESPLVEALNARFLGNDQWELTGTLYVGTNTNINATFQHGLGNFNTSTAATLPTINAGDEVTIQTIVAAPMSMSTYQFRIEVEDSGYSYYSNTITFDLYQMACDENMGTGEVLNEIWTDVGGTNIADFTSLATYPNMPDEVYVRTNGFQGINGFGFNYGSKLSAMLCPPQSGNYTFWIAGDDDCELWLSTSASEAGIRRIAYFDGWTNVDEWDKFSSQNSNNVIGQIYLNAGQTYFLQALHKEGTGGDHVAVRWQLPDNTIENPIAPQHLSLPNPYQGVCEDTNINITADPLSNDYRRASQTITTTGAVEVDVAVEVTFQAGESITLSEDFHAKSDFTARIAECVTTTSSSANEETVEERSASIAPSLSLQVQPNPAQAYTNVVYELAESGEVQISLFDLQGRSIQQFSQVEQNVGTHQLELDLTQLKAGIYLVVLRTEAETKTKKIIVEQ
ncbi:MAG: T9SS type A sorting domain-containing protein, partial [Bacteroidota bacterium]